MLLLLLFPLLPLAHPSPRFPIPTNPPPSLCGTYPIPYCSGTNYTLATPSFRRAHLCGDSRLGPILLPDIALPLDSVFDIYSRFGTANAPSLTNPSNSSSGTNSTGPGDDDGDTTGDVGGARCPESFLLRWWDETTSSFSSPPSSGFALDDDGAPITGDVTLRAGVLVDRFGGEGGSVLSPAGAPFAQRALPPGMLAGGERGEGGFPVFPYNYHVYRVVRPLLVRAGPVAPWFGQPGQGVQYETSENVTTLVATDFLERVDPKVVLREVGNGEEEGGEREGKGRGRGRVRGGGWRGEEDEDEDDEEMIFDGDGFDGFGEEEDGEGFEGFGWEDDEEGFEGEGEEDDDFFEETGEEGDEGLAGFDGEEDDETLEGIGEDDMVDFVGFWGEDEGGDGEEEGSATTEDATTIENATTPENVTTIENVTTTGNVTTIGNTTTIANATTIENEDAEPLDEDTGTVGGEDGELPVVEVGEVPVEGGGETPVEGNGEMPVEGGGDIPVEEDDGIPEGGNGETPGIEGGDIPEDEDAGTVGEEEVPGSDEGGTGDAPEEPVAEEPVAEEPVAEEPVTEEPVAEGPE